MALLKWIPARGTLPLSPKWVATTLADASPDSVPVLFLHGTLGSPGNFERPAQRLAQLGRPFFAPAYGEHGTADLDRSTAELLRYVDHLRDMGIKQVDIVGHSAGGLQGLRIAHARPGFVRKLIGLGAAFRGVPRTVRFKPVVKLITGQAVIQLTQEIPAELPDGVELVSIYSTADHIVPVASSTLGELIEITDIRHEDLPRQADVIMEALGYSAETDSPTD
ncbi:alpha/beta hydrolase [Corynebacterium diphtheriae]|nr:alpha/beta hydrolase [Corynebacterium diphtheriae]